MKEREQINIDQVKQRRLQQKIIILDIYLEKNKKKKYHGNVVSICVFIQNPRHSKLEKADILEMTVRYLRSIHRQQLSGEKLLQL